MNSTWPVLTRVFYGKTEKHLTISTQDLSVKGGIAKEVTKWQDHHRQGTDTAEAKAKGHGGAWLTRPEFRNAGGRERGEGAAAQGAGEGGPRLLKDSGDSIPGAKVTG